MASNFYCFNYKYHNRCVIEFYLFRHLIPRGRLLTVIAFVGIILINVVVCYLIVLLGRKNQAVRENEILKVQQEYNKQYIANAAIEYDAISKLRHDFRDSYTVVYALISEGKNQKAIKYIENNINLLTQTETFIKTNNDVVNAVINAKFSTAKSIGIDCSCFSVADFDGIDDTDLCRLLSNMLENAVTACINLKSSDKQLVLMITSDEYKYTFHLKNTIEKSVLADNPELSTTKSGDHGYGTKIIRDISEKYNGRCDFYEENSFFCCNVILRK